MHSPKKEMMKKIILNSFLFMSLLVQAQRKSSPILYSGTLPCADCNGIVTYLELDSSQKIFRLEQTYTDKSERSNRVDGVMKKKGNQWWLYDDKTIALRIQYFNGNIRILDTNGKPISGNLSSAYILQKRQKAKLSQTAWNAVQRGSKWIGIGNEPAWTIEVNARNHIEIEWPLEGKKMTIKNATIQQDNGKLTYTGIEQQKNYTIEFHLSYSSDGMSDFIYPARVFFSWGETKLKGVGFQLQEPLPQLSGRWNLVFMSGPEMTIPAQFQQRIPFLEFNLKEMRFHGNAGCNTINGAFNAMKDSITFLQPWQSTMMACQGNGEQLFTKLLGQVNTYKFEKNDLLLFQGKKLLLRFRKSASN